MNRERFVSLCQQLLVLGVLAVVALPAARMVTLDIVGPDVAPDQVAGSQNGEPAPAVVAEPDPADVETAPVDPVVTEVALPEAVARSTPGLLISKEQSLAEDSTVGITWAHGEELDEGAITLSLRTRTQGKWSAWEALDYHAEEVDDTADNRPGSEPVFTGDADAVQVKVQVAGKGTVPDDLLLAIVDPGDSRETRVEFPAIDTAAMTAFESGDPDDPGSVDDPSDAAEPAPAGDLQTVAAIVATPEPKIYSRAQWGAKESLRRVKTPTYGEIHGGFVHHTVNANNYTKAQVPKIIRGIYAFHTKSRRWNDIGYNFLVDKWGRIWEGRYGGVGRPVVGAHTQGYNSNSFAMSAIGNYQVKKPSKAMLDAFGRLFAWKLSQHGVSALSGKQKIGKKTFKAISGHRDAGKTSCPGKYLYAKLGTIRSLAAKYQAAMGSRQLSVNISGSVTPDLAVRDAVTKRLSIVHVTQPFALGPQTTVATGLGGVDLIASVGDVTGDGRADLVVRDKATKAASLLPRAESGFGAAVPLGQAFADVDQLVGVGDVNGDGLSDVVGRMAATHDLKLLTGSSGGTFAPSSTLRAHWDFALTSYGDDFDRDGVPELLSADHSGQIWITSIVGGQLADSRVLASGIGAVTDLVGAGDLTNDGFPDLAIRTGDGVRVYQGGNGLGQPLGPFVQMTGLTSLVAMDLTGTGLPDLAGVDAAGALVASSPNGFHGVDIRDTGIDLSTTNLLLKAGDWNRDGAGDLITRDAATGRIQLWLGHGNDAFDGPIYLTLANLNPLSQVIVPGDVTGDGYIDLMGRSGPGGAFQIYPGNGVGQLQTGYRSHSALPVDRLAAAGLFDADGAVDFFATTPDGRLWLYAGNGPGGMTKGSALGGSVAGADWLVGLGDVNGDGRPDLVGRTPGSGLTIFTMGPTGVIGTQTIGADLERFDLFG